MITDAILTLVFGLLDALLALFPSGGAPSDSQAPATFGTTVGAYAVQLNHVLPLSTCVIIIALSETFMLTVTGFKFMLWVYSLIPFKMT